MFLSLVLLLALVSASSPLADRASIPCAFQFEADGPVIDLSPFDVLGTFSSQLAADSVLFWRLCTFSLSPPCPPGASSCQQHMGQTYVTGKTSLIKVGPIGPAGSPIGVELTYLDGTICMPSSLVRTTRVRVVCGHGNDPGHTVRAVESALCSYEVEMVSAHACPKPRRPGQEVNHGIGFVGTPQEQEGLQRAHQESIFRAQEAARLQAEQILKQHQEEKASDSLQSPVPPPPPTTTTPPPPTTTTPTQPRAPLFRSRSTELGGLDEELDRLFRRAFMSRLLPAEVTRRLDIKHVKGVLLHGPPGTGKTLMAREIGKLLNCKTQLVNGPEIMNKYLGQSEENLRKLFKPAEDDFKALGEAAPLHLIIFDELDALFRARGSMDASLGAAVYDGVTNQLLSKMDGVEAVNNILVIGMTNRRELLDPALLRPGRFEVQLEIGLPDEPGREQIFHIHTRTLRDSALLSPAVDLGRLARDTAGFTGAEISGVVKSASSFAFQRRLGDADPYSALEISMDNLQVTQDDFDRAVREVEPRARPFARLNRLKRGGFLGYSQSRAADAERALRVLAAARSSPGPSLVTVLISGPAGSGKTATAAHLALASGFTHVTLLTPIDLLTAQNRVSRMHTAFLDAYEAEEAVVVLDDLEELVEWVPMGSQFGHQAGHGIGVLLSSLPPMGSCRLVIIATTSHPEVLDRAGLSGSFDVKVTLHSLSNGDISALLRVTDAVAYADAAEVISQLPPDISLKRLLRLLDMARAKQPQGHIPPAVLSSALADLGWNSEADPRFPELPPAGIPSFFGQSPPTPTPGRQDDL